MDTILNMDELQTNTNTNTNTNQQSDFQSVVYESDLSNMSRSLYAKDVEQDKETSVNQTILRKESVKVANPNEPIYYGTTQFPQPAIVGAMSVMGAPQNGSYIDPTGMTLGNWKIQNIIGGEWLVTHNLGTLKYNVQVTADVGWVGTTVGVYSKTTSTFKIRTGSTTQNLNIPFSLVVYSIPNSV